MAGAMNGDGASNECYRRRINHPRNVESLLVSFEVLMGLDILPEMSQRRWFCNRLKVGWIEGLL